MNFTLYSWKIGINFLSLFFFFGWYLGAESERLDELALKLMIPTSELKEQLRVVSKRGGPICGDLNENVWAGPLR